MEHDGRQIVLFSKREQCPHGGSPWCGVVNERDGVGQLTVVGVGVTWAGLELDQGPDSARGCSSSLL